MAGRKAVLVPPSERVLVTVAVAAEFLSISEASCRRLIDADKLPSVKLGDRRMVTRAALERFAALLDEVGRIAITGEETAG